MCQVLLTGKTVACSLKITTEKPLISSLQGHICSEVILSGIFKSVVTNKLPLKSGEIWQCLQQRLDQIPVARQMQKENVAMGLSRQADKMGKQALEHYRIKYSGETFQRTELCIALSIITVHQFLLLFVFPKMNSLEQLIPDGNTCLKPQALIGNARAWA